MSVELNIAPAIAAAAAFLRDDPEVAEVAALGQPPSLDEVRLKPVEGKLIARWQQETGSDPDKKRPLLRAILILEGVRLAAVRGFLRTRGEQGENGFLGALELLPVRTQQQLENGEVIFTEAEIVNIDTVARTLESKAAEAAPAATSFGGGVDPALLELRVAAAQLRNQHSSCVGPLAGVWRPDP